MNIYRRNFLIYLNHTVAQATKSVKNPSKLTGTILKYNLT